ncbi:trigger factor [candidate division CSSED10-310 bacterium]|uniref:Trigger factor n=1 Tax=candidate division CSSED10-310 bacterium TaxID=2855610 RepID=A0ABV6YZF2_UNCC1
MFTHSIKTVNDYTREVTGEIAKETVDEHYNKVLLELKRQTFVPGFRKGKVPLSFLKKRFGNEIKAQVIEEVFQEYYPKIIETTKLHPVSTPNIQQLDFNEGEALKFAFSTEVIVMDEPHDYFDIDIELRSSEVEDAEIQNYLKTLQHRQGQIQVVEDRPSKNGDILILDVDASHDDTEIASLQREKAQMTLGMNMVCKNPRFDEEIVGLKPEETKEFTIQFEHDEEDEELAGKTITVKVTLHEIKEIVLPELDDDFAISLGEFKSLTELKDKIQQELTDQKETQDKTMAIETMIDKILAKNHIIIPPSIIDQSAKSMANNYVQRTGVELSAEEQKEKFEGEAIRSLKKTVILAKIAEKEKVSVDDEEVRKIVREYVDKFAALFQKDKKFDEQEYFDSVKRNLIESKTIDLLFEKAQKEMIPPQPVDAASDEGQSD